MGTIEEIRKMRREGKNDLEIREDLRARGVSENEIGSGLSQSQIKDAVASDSRVEPDQLPPYPQEEEDVGGPLPEGPTAGVGVAGGNYSAPSTQEYEGMDASIASGGLQNQGYSSQLPQEGYSASPQGQGNAGQAYSQDGLAATGYPAYQPYQETMSSDLITEISEQVVEEKLSFMRDKLEKALDFKSVAETRIQSIDERLRRIERIIDRLQLSLLQKVGDYVNEVGDVKQELIETQKSFKTLHPVMKSGHRHTKHKRKHKAKP